MLLFFPQKKQATEIYEIRDYLVRKANEAGWGASLEPKISPSHEERADLLVQGMASAPQNIEAWDVTVTHPLRDSASTAARVSPGVSAFDAEKLKLANVVSGLCGTQGIGFRPLGFETTGAMGRKARAGIQLLAAKLGLSSGTPTARAFTLLCRDLSVLLAKGNGEMLTRQAPHRI